MRCDRLTTPHRLIGPSLWKLGERADAAAIRASILTPDAVVTPGYPARLMRLRLQALGFYTDIERQPAILERLVAYLAGLPISPPETAATAPVTEGMVRLQAGLSHLPDGQPVAVAAFTIDPAPVTTMQYEAFIAAGGYTIKRYWDRTGWAVVVRRRKRTQPVGWKAQQHMSRARPVTGVSWYEADAYCRWTGKTLPTEMQWQRACQEVAAWYGPAAPAGRHWEWTDNAVWKGGADASGPRPAHCAARLPSYPALDSRHTGFRCIATASPASP